MKEKIMSDPKKFGRDVADTATSYEDAQTIFKLIKSVDSTKKEKTEKQTDA